MKEPTLTITIDSTTFISSSHALNLVIGGSTIEASSAGTIITGVVARNLSDKRLHCGVLLNFCGGVVVTYTAGSTTRTATYYHALVHRFSEKTLVHFTTYQRGALDRLTNNSWTPTFGSKKLMTKGFSTMATCGAIADFLRQDIVLKSKVLSVGPRQSIDTVIADAEAEKYSNCFVFMIKGAEMLGSMAIRREVISWSKAHAFDPTSCEAAARPCL